MEKTRTAQESSTTGARTSTRSARSSRQKKDSAVSKSVITNSVQLPTSLASTTQTSRNESASLEARTVPPKGKAWYTVEVYAVKLDGKHSMQMIAHIGYGEKIKKQFRPTARSWVECIAKNEAEALTLTQTLVEK